HTTLVRAHGMPAYLVNARLPERSLRGYRVLVPLVGRAPRTLARVAAQSEADGARFVRLGVEPDAVAVLGNLKFDIRVDDAARRTAAAFAEHSGGRMALIDASTIYAEEAADNSIQ